MIKKAAVLLMTFVAAYIFLPFGFGLWNESISVYGRISIAEPSPSEDVSESVESIDMSAASSEIGDLTADPIEGGDTAIVPGLSGDTSAVTGESCDPSADSCESGDAPADPIESIGAVDITPPMQTTPETEYGNTPVEDQTAVPPTAGSDASESASA